METSASEMEKAVLAVTRAGSPPSSRNRLNNDEKIRLASWIRDHRHEYETSSQLFNAALAATGLVGRMVNSSSAVWRWTSQSTKAGKYIRKAKVQAKHQPPPTNQIEPKPKQVSILLNYCPNCGLNLKGVALGMATSHLS